MPCGPQVMWEFTGFFLINIGSLKEVKPSNATVAVDDISPKQILPEIVKVGYMPCGPQVMQEFTGLFLIIIGSLKEAEPSNATVAVAGIFTKTRFTRYCESDFTCLVVLR